MNKRSISNEIAKSPQKLEGLSLVVLNLNKKIDNAVNVLLRHKATVFISGNTGIGKYILAKAIMNRAQKTNRKIRVESIDCSNIPKDLVASELFGSKKGAFTGAEDKKGLLSEIQESIRKKEYDDAILFIDEIGNVAPDVQGQLLLAVEGHEVRPLGGGLRDQFKISFSLMFATNKLQDSFREDFFYRISVYHLKIPPLSERKIDIVPYVCKIIKDHRLDDKKGALRFDLPTWFKLFDYNWTDGGYRELRKEIFNLWSDGKLSEEFIIKWEKQKKTISESKIPLGEDKSITNESKDIGVLLEVQDGIIQRELNALAGISFNPQEILSMITEEIKYYKIHKPLGLYDPRELFEYYIFILGLSPYRQKRIAKSYIPYNSYIRPIPESDKTDLTRLLNANFEIGKPHKPLPRYLSMAIPNESEIYYLLDKYGFDKISAYMKLLLLKIKYQFNLPWREIEQKNKIKRQTIQAILKEKDKLRF